tara:strand:+ start:503 stop:1117 length:615 start_codon:yes stop_codon:yes gene_type:complete
MIGIKKINSYKEYLSLQKKKTEDPVRRKKWISNITENKQKFKPTFSQYLSIFDEYREGVVYCLGARTGEEVLCLRDMGFANAMGTDLVPFDEHVIECDIHNMIFDDNSVDFYYTNIFDHSIDPSKFVSEIQRTLKFDGICFLQIQLGRLLDEYGVLFIDEPKDFEKLLYKFDNLSLIISESNSVLTPHNHGLNWNFIIKKEKND